MPGSQISELYRTYLIGKVGPQTAKNYKNHINIIGDLLRNNGKLSSDEEIWTIDDTKRIESLTKFVMNELQKKDQGIFKGQAEWRLGKNHFSSAFNSFLEFIEWKKIIDYAELQKIIEAYKNVFSSKQWPDEKYKWIAVKYFQDNWDIDAPDFAAMLKQALAKTDNLLGSAGRFPRRMIREFAEVAPEQVRTMFRELFDETQDIGQRVKSFKEKSQPLLEIHGKNAQNHYQDENTIFTYLWLRYPEKYYIYKISEIKEVAKQLKSELIFKNGKYEDNIHNFLKLYNVIRLELLKDDELKALLQSQLTDDCYADDSLCTMTIDFGFYISRRYKNENDWYPADYDPKISVAKWIELLNDPEVFNTASLEVMKRMQDYDGEATCTQLANKYGNEKNFYNKVSSSLAERIAQKTACPVHKREDGSPRWWAILYLGKENDNKSEGSFTWKLRPELVEALKQVDLSAVKLYVNEERTEKVNYYLLSWNPKKGAWFYGDNGNHASEGEENYFQAIKAVNSGEILTEAWRCSNSHVKPGDKVFMIKLGDGIKGIFAYGIVEKAPYKYNYEGEEKQYIDVKFTSISDYRKKVLLQDELKKNFSEQDWSPQSSGIAIKEKYGKELEALWNNLMHNKDAYSKEDFLSEVFMTSEKYDSLVRMLKIKKNIILQGAPGVGKTFAAKRLAYSIMGEIDESRIEFVQFHQNYSYEDFVMGYKPEDNGFKLKSGIFHSFCQKAANDPEREYFFIIDEINRGNMSKIFGELLMLIEKDYRDKPITLAYNGLPFSVPSNLHIIGMMNTADRSLAMIDYALRRRFSFFDIEPGFDSEGFIAHQQNLSNEKLDALVAELKKLNDTIADDKSLGKGFCIGHSYLCNPENCIDDNLKNVVEYDILPMLAEYWFDEMNKYDDWAKRLMGIFE